MPSSTAFGMQHLNENMMCSIGIVTTGNNPEEDEILQISVIPLDANLDHHREHPILDFNLTPLRRREKIEIPGWSQEEYANAIRASTPPNKVATMFELYFTKLGLREGKRIIPLAHGWLQMSRFLIQWMGEYHFYYYFDQDRYRDVQVIAGFLNDVTDFMQEKIMYPKVSMGMLCKRNNIEYSSPFTALNEARSTMFLYKQLMKNRILHREIAL